MTKDDIIKVAFNYGIMAERHRSRNRRDIPDIETWDAYKKRMIGVLSKAAGRDA